VIASKNWTQNATYGDDEEKMDGGVTGQPTTWTPWNFDAVNPQRTQRNERKQRNSRKKRKLQPMGTELSSFQLNSSF